METTRSADGTEIAYEREGSGPPLVLVGGAFSDRRGGAALAELLAPSFDVVRFDRRGRGDSGDSQPYAVEREIEDVLALLDVVGGSAAVYGHSSGAVLSLAAALAGAPITKLALYEPPFEAAGLDTDLQRRVLDALAAGDRATAIKAFLVGAVELPEAAVAQAEQWPDWDGMLAIAPTLAYDLAIVGDGRIPTGAADLAVPTLVLHGTRSQAWMQASNDRLAATIPGAVGKALDGQDHNADPAVVVAELVSFLA